MEIIDDIFFSIEWKAFEEILSGPQANIILKDNQDDPSVHTQVNKILPIKNKGSVSRKTCNQQENMITNQLIDSTFSL